MLIKVVVVLRVDATAVQLMTVANNVERTRSSGREQRASGAATAAAPTPAAASRQLRVSKRVVVGRAVAFVDNNDNEILFPL